MRSMSNCAHWSISPTGLHAVSVTLFLFVLPLFLPGAGMFTRKHRQRVEQFESQTGEYVNCLLQFVFRLACVPACASVYVRVYVCLYMRVCESKCVCMFACARTSVCLYVCVCACVCVISECSPLTISHVASGVSSVTSTERLTSTQMCPRVFVRWSG